MKHPFPASTLLCAALLLAAGTQTAARAEVVCTGNCTSTGADLNVGNTGGGEGSLSVNGGSMLSFGGGGAIGAFGSQNPGGITRGTLLVDGMGSRIATGGVSNSQFWVGSDGGTGSMTLSNGAVLSVDAFNNPGGFGDARLYVGRNGTGDVRILSGASVIVRDTGSFGADDDIMIGRGGNDFEGHGSVLVSGGSLALSGNSAYLNVGRANISGDGPLHGDGLLRIDSGGTVTIDGQDSEAGLHIARGDNSSGRIEIVGGGSRLDMRGAYTTAWIANDWYALPGAHNSTGVAQLYVGQQGVLNLKSEPVPAGQLRTDMHIGYGLGSAEVLVDSGGRIELANGLKISSDGSTGERKQFGHLTINDTGVVSAGAYTFIGNGDASRISGVLSGTGTLVSPRVELRNGGEIAPGNSPGTLHIQGDLKVVGGVLELQVAGAGAGEHDVLDVSGALSFTGGTIELSFIDGYLPRSGDSFSLINAASLTGLDLASISFTGLAQGFQYAVDPSGGMFTVLALNDAAPVPEPQTLALLLAGLGLAVLRLSTRHTRNS